MRAALVIGADTHVGNALTRALVAAGVPTRAAVAPGAGAAPLAGLPIDVVQPARRFAELVPAMVGAQVAFMADLAATAADARAVVAACRHANVSRLVYLAPMGALQQPRGGEWLDELTGLHSEPAKLVEEAAVHGEVDAVLLLLSNLLGPWDFTPSASGALLASIGLGRSSFAVDSRSEWLDVRDAADAAVTAAASGRCAETYLLSGGLLSLQRICELVAGDAGVALPTLLPQWLGWLAGTVRHTAVWPGPSWQASTLKARQELDFNPRPLERSVLDAWAWLATYPHSPLRPALEPHRRALRVAG